MGRIDRETVQRIIDTADIVDVVGDFVSLRRRGANYIGLCPFHNERTPSFSVSRSKGICKCFSCGKGGSPVNFLMELEQMSFNEALRWLARKYNIEIVEHDLTDEERRAATERENMFAVNDFALSHFSRNLTETPEGRAVGLAYFRERGITDRAIERFHLGFALDDPTDFLRASTAKGLSNDAVIATGLCYKSETTGAVRDRFRGRVIYPVHTISGKTVAFGGRTLTTDKKIAKYVNSPESVIYSKSNQLYGLYQAKNAISKADKCILVEGYMDVISMSQSGIENVVASSGTSLTQGQIRLIHRFTENVTVIYDSDPAGIKASLRGIDLLLAEGMKVKTVLLPDGDDPDSFAQSHSATEVESYIAENETDFIRFKTHILLADGGDSDPLRRAAAINDVISTIAVIPDEITRTVYIQQTAADLCIDETTVASQVARLRYETAERRSNDLRRDAAHASITSSTNAGMPISTSNVKSEVTTDEEILRPVEDELIRYIVQYGMFPLPVITPKGEDAQIPMFEYIMQELKTQNLQFTVPLYIRTAQLCSDYADTYWESDYERFKAQSLIERQRQWAVGEEAIRKSAQTLTQIKTLENKLQSEVDVEYHARENEFCRSYLSRMLMSCPDDEVRAFANDIAVPRYKLSKIHERQGGNLCETDVLMNYVPRAVGMLKDAHMHCRCNELLARLKSATSPSEEASIMTEMMQIERQRKQLALFLGERVVKPKT